MSDDIRDDVAASFLELTGREPDGLWSAPGRVNLIGEHTDYNEGYVLPFAIDRRTVVAFGLREDRHIRVASELADEVVEIELDALDPDSVAGWSAYPLGVAWALGESGADLDDLPGFDALIDSTVPVGAGLSSSAAIECAVAVALNERWQLDLDRPTLARVGQLAENSVVGAPTGIMDQSASMLGERGAAVFLDCRSLHSELVPLDLDAAGLVIAVIDTQTAHEHATGGYASRRESCERGARELGVASLRDVSVDDLPRAQQVLDEQTFRRVRHVVTENQRVLDTVRALRTDGPRSIGELLLASHASMRDDFEISTPELDLAVETAVAVGAVGARMTGGGFGGAAIALLPAEHESRLRVAVDGAFSEHGFQVPNVFTVTPDSGAKRE